MDSRIVEVMRNARKPLVMNAREGDDVLIVADTKTDALVWQAFAAAAQEVGANPTVLITLPLPFHHANPPRPVAAALREANLAILVTSKAMLHSTALEEISQGGTRVIASEEVTVEMLCSPAAAADYHAMEALGQRVMEIWTSGNEVRVLSALGTNISADIKGRAGYMCAGKCVPLRPGSSALLCAFPDGEASIAPVEGTANGTVVWDTTMHHIGRIKEPIRAEFRDGRLVRLEGGDEAVRLKDYLEEYGDEGARQLGEIAIGLNPGVVPTGVVRTDKKMYGAVHIALGMNTDVGGNNQSRLHIDGVICKPSVYIDGKGVVEDGMIRV
jgi:leucyl aminopeptidase (aminopeptidase T)